MCSVPGGEGKYQKVLADVGSKYVTVFDPLDGSSNVSIPWSPLNLSFTVSRAPSLRLLVASLFHIL